MNVSDFYSVLLRYQRAFFHSKSSKQYLEESFCDLLNENLGIINKQLRFSVRSGCLYFFDLALTKAGEKLTLPAALLKLRTLNELEQLLSSFSNQIIRALTNSLLEEECCDESAAPLVTVSKNVQDMLDDTLCTTSRTKEICEMLKVPNYSPIIVYGDSSSGKTVAVAQAVGRLISTGKYATSWYDLSDVNIEPEHILYELLSFSYSDKIHEHIIVVDNAQAAPSKVRLIMSIVRYLNSSQTQTVFRPISISWCSAKNTLINMMLPLQAQAYYCSGNEIISQLIASAHLERYTKEIIANSAGDVFVAHQIVSFIQEKEKFPTFFELSSMIYDNFLDGNTLSKDAKRALYVVAALGEFEIHVRTEYLETLSHSGYVRLCELGLLRKYYTEDGDSYISIGHRSFAHMIALKLKEDNSKNPIDLAIEYLSIEGDKQISSTLERLDLELQTGESTFANLWKAYLNMKRSLIKQVIEDPTWGNNMASMSFAAEAFANMQFESISNTQWDRTVSEIRKRWCPDPESRTIVFVGNKFGIESTIENCDFTDNIYQTMKEEEAEYKYSPSMCADSIDFQKFHDNWLLGLLLGVEGKAKDSHEYRDKYIECAKHLQQRNGAFYPERVSWVTARVILGLCQCGLSYNDAIVKDACNWLVSSAVISPPDEMNWEISEMNCYGWRSGTGKWNSNEQITLMNLCALYAAKYPIKKNAKIDNIVNNFWINRSEMGKLFSQKGTILDTMWIIDVMLFDGKNPIELKDEIGRLTDYVINQWDSASLLSSEKQTESSDVSFMAKELVLTIWSLLNMNLEQLLKGLEISYKEKRDSQRIFISYRRAGGGSVIAQALYKELNNKYKDDVFLDVVRLQRECNDFSELIENAVMESKVVVVVVTEHAFDRACVKDYNNQSDVYYNELSTALSRGKDVDVIVVYSTQSKQPECPEELRVNPEFYNIAQVLSKKNAVFYDATIPDAMQKLQNDVMSKIKL